MKILLVFLLNIISLTGISQTSNFILGEYITIKGHPKAKGVNMEIKTPIGWEIKEGDRPNIIKKFIYSSVSYMVQVLDNVTFFSRDQIKDEFKNEKALEEFTKESISFLIDAQIINNALVTVDNYPAIQFKAKGKMERMGMTVPIIMNNWSIFYEDKIVNLQAIGKDDNMYTSLEKLLLQITNSVILPDQYNLK